MSNEKVLVALFEHIEINKSYYFEGAYYRLKDYGDHIYGLQRAIPGMCGEKTACDSCRRVSFLPWDENADVLRG